jgi:hypothetical protein
MEKKPWPLATINGIKDKINTNPDYQRPLVWTESQKQLLIDTILRDYDIPKLYWRRTQKRPERYDVIDGQQRLRTIWSFFNNEISLPKDSDSIYEYNIAGLKYYELPDELRIKFDTYSLDIVIFDDIDEEEVREMFLRLQNGTTLKAQEKRNAYPGKMRDFVHSLSKHQLFIEKVGFRNARFNHDLVAAQIVCLEMAGGPTNIKNTDLNKMYLQNTDFDFNSAIAKKIIKNLNLLNEIFAEKTPELERYNVIALYCVLNELQSQYVFTEIKDKFYDWFIEFEKLRRKLEGLNEEEADPEWITYKDKISHSTDSSDSVRWRMEFMLRNLLDKYPNLPIKDNQREFTQLQKMTIFRKDKGTCQVKLKCNGDKVTWDNWHCDHIIPWTKGGMTTVENGQVSCSSCNLSKGSNN